ncbi:hypothetical protein N0V82_004197 [Gnomoniopsis sp. IMI 355080]|nr:hypothetical protein N0V82_004197 [Gnomoniopsis sp. IMI 355080]
MSAVDVDIPVQRAEPDKKSKETTAADSKHETTTIIEDEEEMESKTREGEVLVNGHIKTPAPIRAGTATHLPSPLPSPAPATHDDHEGLGSRSASPPNGGTYPSSMLGLITTGIDGMGLDLSSCAVSEADTDAPNSAVESSTDALPPDLEIREIPKKEPSRNSSVRRTRDRSGTKSSDHSGVRRLSASKIQELTTSPDSLPIAPVRTPPLSAGVVESGNGSAMTAQLNLSIPTRVLDKVESIRSETSGDASSGRTLHSDRPTSVRALTTPAKHRKSVSQPGSGPRSSRSNSFQPSPRPMPLNLEGTTNYRSTDAPKSIGPETEARNDTRDTRERRESRAPSPMPPVFPIPPMSAPTFLQLELAAQRPSPLYIYQSSSDIPYESSAVKFERLKNFIFLSPLLERSLVFGALACLDAWLWTLTILPLRFFRAVKVLVGWWGYVFAKEIRWLTGFVWEGLGRLWRRARLGRDTSRRPSMDSRRSSEAGTSRSPSRVREPLKELSANGSSTGFNGSSGDALKRTESGRAKLGDIGLKLASLSKSRSLRGPYHHKRTKSIPSNLSSFHKADLLQFAVIIMSCVILTQLDSSRVYHFIRAQSAVKLYVIYNLIEVGDRLLSALGQDIFECLFSSETLSRNSLGRSKVLLPFGMFCLALVYNCAHAMTLFYQVITLNVAVNSYSNALLTLLMSNQFVEIKGSVFKKFEKENLFQLTCADIVERFQIWIVLLIIGMRNMVEVGGLSMPSVGIEFGNEGSPTADTPLPVLPSSFNILPSWLWSGELLSPFLVVIASEMIVDTIKHAYINKFNNIKPNFYSRVLDILCKDYYTNAFVTPSLTRRLGLPLLPLSTLFIRSSFQTYRMFLATHMPAPLPPSTQTSLSVESSTPTSPAVTAALDRLDHMVRNALGRSVYGLEGDAAANATSTSTGKFSWLSWSTDDAIALTTLLLVIFIVWIVLLILKLVLGMFLLRYSRDRYARMKLKEQAVASGKAEKESFDAKGKRVGGFGAVEIGDERRGYIYMDDPEGLKRARDRERKMEEKRDKGGDGDRDLSGVTRYEMVAKRIW